LHTTKDCYGSLKELVPFYTFEDERNYIKISLNNLFHEICHRYIHSSRQKNIEALPSTFKAVFFILQNIHYLNTGTFITKKQDLFDQIKDNHKEILAMAMKIKYNTEYDFDFAFNLLFNWCQKAIVCLGKE
jgi:hypothetical protein